LLSFGRIAEFPGLRWFYAALRKEYNGSERGNILLTLAVRFWYYCERLNRPAVWCGNRPALSSRLVRAVEMEIGEDWIAGKRYVTMNAENENEDKNVNSNKENLQK
jgi:hypothetical protein